MRTEARWEVVEAAEAVEEEVAVEEAEEDAVAVAVDVEAAEVVEVDVVVEEVVAEAVEDVVAACGTNESCNYTSRDSAIGYIGNRRAQSSSHVQILLFINLFISHFSNKFLSLELPLFMNKKRILIHFKPFDSSDQAHKPHLCFFFVQTGLQNTEALLGKSESIDTYAEAIQIVRSWVKFHIKTFLFILLTLILFFEKVQI